MRYAAGAAFLYLTLCNLAVAQSAPTPDTLSATQRDGQKMFYQSCGVCHTKPQITATQFAPVLSKESVSGNESAVRGIIADGTPRMPGFKYQFNAEQIASITSYVMAIPAPPAPAPASAPAATQR
jgi:mono/diheme cytochrome c family protein